MNGRGEALPLSLRVFAGLWGVGIVASVVSLIGQWPTLTLAEPGDPDWMPALLTGVLLAFGAGGAIIGLAVLSAVVRTRSRTGRWVAAAIAVLQPVVVLWAYLDDPSVWMILDGANAVCTIVAVAALFTPGARRWFEGVPQAIADVFS